MIYHTEVDNGSSWTLVQAASVSDAEQTVRNRFDEPAHAVRPATAEDLVLWARCGGLEV